ncbi:MAG: lysophospholipase [Pseudonocardiales bacterium]|nr:lysophospholipase [Pseudonocardiales bacterium]
MSTRHDEGHREIAPGRFAYWQAWLPRDPGRAVVVIVHGLHEHSARYTHVGARLAAAGFAVYAADHRGHGRSDGRRANIERMTLIVEDLSSFVRFAVERHPGLPVFMVGHSLGGLIALHYATEPGATEPGATESGATESGALLDGLVVSGPAVEVLAGSALQRRLARVLSALVPNLGVVAIDTDQKISRDPEVVRAYRTDPLVYRGKVKARTGAEMLATMEGLPARLPRLSTPLLLLHGTDDRICAPAGSAMVHDAVSSPDKTLRRYQGLYHEVFNEPERDQILTDLLSWLNQHLPATHSAG